jgi:MOSC domain-containing protein YiiM
LDRADAALRLNMNLGKVIRMERRGQGFGKLPCAGVYANVVKAGTIRRGDAVHYLETD